MPDLRNRLACGTLPENTSARAPGTLWPGPSTPYSEAGARSPLDRMLSGPPHLPLNNASSGSIVPPTSSGEAARWCCDGNSPAWRFSLRLKLSPRMLSTWLWCSSRSSTAEAMTVSPSSSPHWPNTPSPLTEVVLDTSCVPMTMPGPYGDQPPPRDRPGRPLRAGVTDRIPPATPPQRHPGRRRAHRADSAGRENGAPDQRGGPRRLPPGHLLSRQAVLFHPGLAGDRRRDGDHGRATFPSGRPGPSPAAAPPSRCSSPAFLGWATWNTAPMPRRLPGSGSPAAPCANRATVNGGRFTTTGRASPR